MQKWFIASLFLSATVLNAADIASLEDFSVETPAAATPAAAVSAPVTSVRTPVQTPSTATLTAPGWKVTAEKKIINVELPSGQFLELTVPTLKYTPKAETRIQLTDIARVTAITNELTAYLTLPTAEQIQPQQLARLQKLNQELRRLHTDLKSRIDPEEMPQ